MPVEDEHLREKPRVSENDAFPLRPPSFAYSSLLPYVATASIVLIFTALGKALQPLFDLVNIALLYLLPVLVCAVRWGLGPSLVASFLGMLCYDFFFVPPFLSFTVDDVRHLLNFAVFLVVALVTGTLASRLRSQADLAKEGQIRASTLYALSHRIAAETDLRGVLQTVLATVVSHVKARDASVLMPAPPYNALTVVAHSLATDIQFDHKEKSIAQWVFEHRQQAGQGTNVPARTDQLFMPIFERETSLAVLTLQLQPEQLLSEREKKDLEAFTSLTALAITRMHLAREAEQAKWLAESEKLHRSLLNAVSHDLRTPLSSITGAVTGLMAEGDKYDLKTRETLLETIHEGAQRMNRFIANLLDMARLESGILRPNREWVDMADLVGVALKEIKDMLPERRLEIEVPADLPLIQADFALIEQVLINLLENAVKYSRPDTKISIVVVEEPACLKIAVGDQAAAIPNEDYDRLFDKFYRLQGSKHVAGTGLGLSICKGIIEAHGGRIWIESAAPPKEGNIFAFTLPLPKGQPPSAPAASKENESDV